LVIYKSSRITPLGHAAVLPYADFARPPCRTGISSFSCRSLLKCRSCKKGRYAPPVHMIKLTETREITPYLWER
jgi:hypothetical protein